MHPLYTKAHALTGRVIGAAIDMKLLNVPIGLLINYHEPLLKAGITRLILHGADQP